MILWNVHVDAAHIVSTARAIVSRIAVDIVLKDDVVPASDGKDDYADDGARDPRAPEGTTTPGDWSRHDLSEAFGRDGDAEVDILQEISSSN